MPYKDITLTFLNGEKLKINPGLIMGMLGLSGYTLVNLVRQQLMVMEKMDEIKNLIEVIGEEEYWKIKMRENGINLNYIAMDELK